MSRPLRSLGSAGIPPSASTGGEDTAGSARDRSRPVAPVADEALASRALNAFPELAPPPERGRTRVRGPLIRGAPRPSSSDDGPDRFRTAPTSPIASRSRSTTHPSLSRGDVPRIVLWGVEKAPVYSTNPWFSDRNNPDNYDPTRAARRDRSTHPTDQVPDGEDGPLALSHARRHRVGREMSIASQAPEARPPRTSSPPSAGRAFEPAPRPTSRPRGQQRRASDPGMDDTSSLASRPPSRAGSDAPDTSARSVATSSRRTSLAPASEAAGPQAAGPSMAPEAPADPPSRWRRFVRIVSACLPFKAS